MVDHTDQKIAEVHHRLDALVLLVLVRPAPQVDVRPLSLRLRVFEKTLI